MKSGIRKWKTAIYILLLIIILTSLFVQIYHPHTENFDPTARYMQGVDIVYWVNLDRSHERRELMETVFSDPVFENTPNQRFPAIDGKTVDVFSYFEPSEKETPRLNNVEYACLISHLEVIRTFSESDYAVALIMEDDMTLEFKDYWKKPINDIIEEAPTDWEVIQLCYIGQPAVELYDAWRFSTGAYIINKKGAAKLMELKEKGTTYDLKQHPNAPYLHADSFIFSYLKTYCYKYPMFIYKDDNDSLLHPTDIDSHKESKQRIVKMYENI